MKKASKIVFVNDKLESAFYSLNPSDPIKKALVKSIRLLQNDVFAGIQIPKRLIPVDYVKQYGVNNLWKLNLSSGWRLLYTITPDDEVEIIVAILDWFDHKKYERKMKY